MNAFTNNSLSDVVVFDHGFSSFGRIREFPIRFGRNFRKSGKAFGTSIHAIEIRSIFGKLPPHMPTTADTGIFRQT